ncbi:MAG: UDP-N-acetylglucosamine 4,6-dehydratase, partial [Cohnella sp.]|nr:UDP-N-acetylglucosamine 4,6-dehydratase [Cohnella sp.]
VLDMAEVLIDAYGINDARIIEIGGRRGEKLSEVLISPLEASHSVILQDRYIVVLPTIEVQELKQAYVHCPPVRTEGFQPEEVLMTKKEIGQMLIEGGFLSEDGREGDESER